MIRRLKEANKVPVHSVGDGRFKTYGRVLEGYDFNGLIRWMEMETEVPEEGNTYVPSVPEMESLPVCGRLQDGFFGGMDIEVGYCNGKNTTLNGMEYHKSSEINVAVTDCMLILGHVWDIHDNHFRVEDAEVFFLERGTAIELYATTLHLSPCRTSDAGFKAVVILPRGTNTDLERPVEPAEGQDRLLLMRNKWVMAHPERKPLLDRGAHPGIIGENLELRY
ncbi:DUF4867 family protein [Clostridiales bacterium F-3ap]|uniref:DUF4867 family protein n=2 Tax=Anaerotalea alkaliphila TaxID=2662126 RepID=A0A7X5HUS7_9FIRM|nr:DUF4867 family protein [Anaerotalea alkaliphila]NDL67014.1 DUF4867 family protein [Anaerotalea alkaliphila]